MLYCVRICAVSSVLFVWDVVISSQVILPMSKLQAELNTGNKQAVHSRGKHNHSFIAFAVLLLKVRK